MGLFSTLSLGNRALQASQLGLDVTGQNIANANVEGYSRKRLTQTAAYRYDGTYGQVGFGVNVENIARMRNEHIDTQIRGQLEEMGRFQAVDSTLETLEGIMKEPSDNGIQHYMEKFFDSWENLSNNPKDQAARTMLSTQAETLTSVFHNFDSELSKLRDGNNNQIAAEVNDVNKVLRELDKLNKEITSVELAGQNANDSRDRRDQILKDLSELIDYDIREDSSGAVTLTSGGNILISPTTVNQLEVFENSASKEGDRDFHQYKIRISSSKREMKVNGGKIKGLIDTRDTLIPKYQDKLDNLAVALTEKVNEQHNKGYNLNGYTSFDFFNPTATGAADIAVADTIKSNVDNIAAARGGSVESAAQNVIPATALNTSTGWVELTKDGVSDDASNIVKGSITVKVNQSGTDKVLEEGTDYAIDYRDGTIQWLNAGYDGNEKVVDFDYMSGNFPGPGNNENAIAMSELRDAVTMTADGNRVDNMSFSDYYGATIGELGIDRDEAASNSKTREVLIEEYRGRQDSVAGVSLDEEMANLIKYQHTYQASARIITTTRDMLDILMRM
ncbi:MAG: flagellar hook-associated protein FlgK [Fibrobacterota bacterium]